jgi:hypothetical protein
MAAHYLVKFGRGPDLAAHVIACRTTSGLVRVCSCARLAVCALVTANGLEHFRIG